MSSHICRSHSKLVFPQIATQIVQKPPSELRCSSRAWKVTLVGEAADDAGGVFDETIALMCEVSGHVCVHVCVCVCGSDNDQPHASCSDLILLHHSFLLPSLSPLLSFHTLFSTCRSFRVIPWTYSCQHLMPATSVDLIWIAMFSTLAVPPPRS